MAGCGPQARDQLGGATTSPSSCRLRIFRHLSPRSLDSSRAPRPASLSAPVPKSRPTARNGLPLPLPSASPRALPPTPLTSPRKRLRVRAPRARLRARAGRQTTGVHGSPRAWSDDPSRALISATSLTTLGASLPRLCSIPSSAITKYHPRWYGTRWYGAMSFEEGEHAQGALVSPPALSRRRPKERRFE